MVRSEGIKTGLTTTQWVNKIFLKLTQIYFFIPIKSIIFVAQPRKTIYIWHTKNQQD